MTTSMLTRVERRTRRAMARPGCVLALVGAIWAVEMVDIAIGHRLDAFGILPRTSQGLPGIALSPFLHVDLQHLILNTLPLLVLGTLVSLQGIATFWRVTAFVTVLGGFGVWCAGRPALHMGASILIFGYFGFLVGRAIYERGFGPLLIAALTLFLYGGAIWMGLAPEDDRVSWEGHLAGLLAGFVAARAGIGRRRGAAAGG